MRGANLLFSVTRKRFRLVPTLGKFIGAENVNFKISMKWSTSSIFVGDKIIKLDLNFDHSYFMDKNGGKC